MPAALSRKRPAARNAARSAARRPDAEVNQSPEMWGRRLARLVGRRFGVRMSRNRALNEGDWNGTPVVIKCAKSKGAPIQVSKNTLERVTEVWGVFLDEEDNAHIWRATRDDFKRAASFYSPREGVPHYLIRLSRFRRVAEHIGVVGHRDVERCEIP